MNQHDRLLGTRGAMLAPSLEAGKFLSGDPWAMMGITGKELSMSLNGADDRHAIHSSTAQKMPIRITPQVMGVSATMETHVIQP